MSKYAYIDFEFNRTLHPDVNLVCCAIRTQEHGLKEFWLHKNLVEEAELIDFIDELYFTDHTFVSYSVEAEARSFLALGLKPLDYDWIDLYLEYRMLLNHCNEFAYGRQLIGGQVKYTKPPKNKYERTEEDNEEANNSKPEYSLAAAAFKLCAVELDTEHKKKMRDLIISDPKYFTPEEREAIMRYCSSDVEFLEEIHMRLNIELKILTANNPPPLSLEADQRLRAEYAVRTAMMVSLGYPVNVEGVRRFADAVPQMLSDLCRDINARVWPESIFEFQIDGPHMLQKRVQEWIGQQEFAYKWLRTDKGAYSISKEAFEKYCGSKHSYEDTIPDQMLRYAKTKQSLNGFMPPKKGRKSFFDYLGPDGRVRPYFNIYGSQSSRSQPSSTGFIFLKSAWMRGLVHPPPGYALAGLDYSSEEFLVSAMISGDKEMMHSYRTGDVYISFAIKTGAAPVGATKKSHPEIRIPYKQTVLGVTYDLGANSLAAELTESTKRLHTPDMAQKLIDQFYEVYADFAAWKKQNKKEYDEYGSIRLPCGWYMFGDNDNFRSVGNVPIQGAGASIMRKAVALAQDRGLDVIFTLHDAIYIQYRAFDFAAIDVLHGCMVEAFDFYFPDSGIMVEGDSWASEYPHDKLITTPKGLPLLLQSRHVDPRAVAEYETFSKYIDPDYFTLFL